MAFTISGGVYTSPKSLTRSLDLIWPFICDNRSKRLGVHPGPKSRWASPASKSIVLDENVSVDGKDKGHVQLVAIEPGLLQAVIERPTARL